MGISLRGLRNEEVVREVRGSLESGNEILVRRIAGEFRIVCQGKGYNIVN